MNTQFHGEQELVIERLDDIPLLISLQQHLGLAELIDEALGRHWLHQGLSLGQLVIVWTAYILSESDHRKVAVEDWAVEHHQKLSEMLGSPVRRTDFTDDRLSQVLWYLSKDEAWQTIEQKLWSNSVSVYRLVPERVRLDATRISGYHPPSDGLMQHGYNSQTPHQAQVKLMAASMDIGASGHLCATEVVSGDQADDPLYLPMIRRLQKTFVESGLLYLGDSKMSALEIRAELARSGDFYLVPLAKVGDVPKQVTQWVNDMVTGTQNAVLIYDIDAEGQCTQLIAAGCQTTRCQQVKLPSAKPFIWEERILIVRSVSQAKKQHAALEHRIDDATEALLALTPSPGRGRRQIRRKAELIEKAEAILAKHEVSDCLRYTFVREQSVKTRYIGRGRGSKTRQKRQTRTTRYQITAVQRDEAAITAACCQMGFKVYATNQPEAQLPLDEAVRLYRAAPRIERHFHLFKSAPVGIQPMYVRNDDQIKGLCRLLSLGVRLMTLIEIVTRRYLATHGQTLVGLYEGQPNRQTENPTAKKILQAFGGIHRVRGRPWEKNTGYTTPLTSLQQQILTMLGLDEHIYRTQTNKPNRLQAFGQRCGQILAYFSHTFNHVLHTA